MGTIQRLQYFPPCFVACWFWELLSVGYGALQSDKELFIIKAMQISMTNLYGALNSLLFAYVIFNFSSNRVTQREPRHIRKANQKLNKKLKKTQTNSKEKEIKGVTVTATATTKTRTTQQFLNVEQTQMQNDELSGLTVSLGVGNVSVMSPTTLSVSAPMTSDVFALDDENGENEDSEKAMLVTVLYNEDESDDFFSSDDEEFTLGGAQVAVIDEEEEMELEMTTRTLTGTGSNPRVALLNEGDANEQ